MRAHIFAAASWALVSCGGKQSNTDALDQPRQFERNLAQSCGLTPNGDPLDPWLAEALAGQRTTFDPGAASKCLTQVRVDGCHPEPGLLGGLSPRLPGWCRQAFLGTLAMGDPCRIDEECTSGGYCSSNDGSPAFCMPREPPGGKCGTHDACSAVDSLLPNCALAPDGAFRCSND